MTTYIRVPQQTVEIPKIPRSDLAQNALDRSIVDLTRLRVWDAFHIVLPGTAADDDLALVGGTFATSCPAVEAGDLKAAGATTRYARFLLDLPAEYDAGETITVVFRAQMATTVADTSCTLDLEAYLAGQAGASGTDTGSIGSDLCATAAQSINSLTDAEYSFTITPTGRVAGDVLDCRIAIACTDGATGTAVIPQIMSITRACDTRG